MTPFRMISVISIAYSSSWARLLPLVRSPDLVSGLEIVAVDRGALHAYILETGTQSYRIAYQQSTASHE